MSNHHSIEAGKQSKLKQYLIYATILLGTTIVIDTLLLSMEKSTKIESIEEEYQSYFNAAGNGHSTYKIHTDEHSFYLAPESIEGLKKDQEVSIRVTKVFNQVISIKTQNESSEKTLLSGFTGIAVPLLIIICMLLGLRMKSKIGILTFVMQVALIADLFYLLF